MRQVLLLLVAVSRHTRAEYKWTGSKWVYLEPDRKEIETYDGSGGDDEDYDDYEDYNDFNTGAAGTEQGGTTGIFEAAGSDKKGSAGSDKKGSAGSIPQQHGGLDSSKFNFIRPGITDDEDFFEGSGDASIPLGGGVGGGTGGLPIDSYDDMEGSGDDAQQYPFGGNSNLSPSFPTTTTTSKSPPIEIEDSDFGRGSSFGGIGETDDTFGQGGASRNNTDISGGTSGSFNPTWSTDDNIKPEDEDYYDDYKDKDGMTTTDVDGEYSPYDDYDFGGGISIDDRKPVVPSVVNPPLTPSTPSPFYPPPVETTSSTRRPIVPEPPIVTDVPTNRPVSFFAQPGILAAVIGGAVVGLLCAILLVMFIVYRMRKKDEGSYILDEPKRVHNGNVYTKTPNREFYA